MTVTTSTDANVATVTAIYEAFGRGDVAFILDRLADDVAWDEGVRPTELPWLQPGRGKAHVLAFFQALGEGLRFTVFEPGVPAASRDQVIVVVREEAVHLGTGKRVEEDLFVHVWTFGADGKIVSFRHIGDWARQEQAAR